MGEIPLQGAYFFTKGGHVSKMLGATASEDMSSTISRVMPPRRADPTRKALTDGLGSGPLQGMARCRTMLGVLKSERT
jgi:hypothetical protein